MLSFIKVVVFMTSLHRARKVIKSEVGTASGGLTLLLVGLVWALGSGLVKQFHILSKA